MKDEESKNIIQCENLVKIYKTSELEVVALQGLDLAVERGELMAIIGNSGSGKSTLLNMIGGLDRPSAGKLYVDDMDLFKLDAKQMIEYKKKTVGFVWQNNSRNLIPYLNAKQNIELVIQLNAEKPKYSALELLDMVGMTHRKDSRLAQLSGGEQQRIAIAIALANNPKLLLADEPTGAVDTKTANLIYDLFRKLNEEMNLSIVIVSHDRQISQKVDRVVAIRDGRTSSEFIRKKTYAQELQELELQEDTTQKEENTHIELAVMDKAGRLQLPVNYLEVVGLKGENRVKVDLEEGRIVLTRY